MTDASSETLDSPRTTLLEPDKPALASNGPVAGGSTTTRAPRRRLGPGRRIPFGRAIGPLLVLGLWSAASASGVLDPRILSAPWKVATTAVDLVSDGRLQTHLLTSLHRAVLGFASGVAVGVLLAVAAGLSRIGEAVVDGTMQVKRALPTLGLIPLLILWLGIGETMKVVVIALVAMIYVYINTFASLTSIDACYVELGEVVGLSRWQFILKIVLPGALPGLFVGLRLSATGALVALIVVEQINATSGIGYMMFQAQQYAQSDIVIVGLIVYGLLGFVSDSVIRIVERRVLSWRRTLAN